MHNYFYEEDSLIILHIDIIVFNSCMYYSLDLYHEILMMYEVNVARCMKKNGLMNRFHHKDVHIEFPSTS